jgi:hypothetical protein
MINYFIVCVFILLVILLAVKLSIKLYLHSNVSYTLPWSVSELDKAARKGHSCAVLLTHDDAELEDVQIEIIDSSCEQGLPHTSDKNTIRMTLDVWNDQSRKEQVLAHERIHILQKRDPEAWKLFYTQHWGYTHFLDKAPSFIPSGIVETVRSNPDTAQHPWCCWQNRYWFAPLYTDLSNPTLKDTTIRVWDQVIQNFTDIPQEWKMLFCSEDGCPHQLEHPHEISAEYLTSPSQTPAYQSLRSWFYGRDGEQQQQQQQQHAYKTPGKNIES